MPFYVPYALDKLSISDATIGLFLAVGAVSGVLSNILWGYMSGRYRCQMDTDLHSITRLHSTVGGDFCAVHSACVAIAVLFSDVCSRGRFNEWHDGRIHDIYD